MGSKIFLLLFCVYYINCEEIDKCNFQTCGECISFAEDNCVWCSKDEIKGRRCMPLIIVNSTNTWCNGNYTKPKEAKMQNVTNNEFNDTVQLRPQRMKIITKPGMENKFPIYFKPAQDYPLDVYYLIDVSYTMENKKKDLQSQANEIYNQLKNFTNNVQLGIGSFIEKPGFPLVDKNIPEHQKVYVFKNHLSLTENIENFTNVMEEITFGGNYDDPEAILDALMQVMVCQDELGWRKHARRIIVLCTDSTYHIAGDGIIIGAIKSNDMRCHLENNTYSDTMALTYDYPSISQINVVASDNKYKIVFAVVKKVSTEYKLLAENIMGAKYSVFEDREDIVNIIKQAYLGYAQMGELFINYQRTFMNLTVNQNCTAKWKCESTPTHRVVTIEGTLLVKTCPPIDERQQEITINVVGLPDKIIIDLRIDCQCDCETETGISSDKCHKAGFLQCGICKCNPESYGIDCHCNGNSSDTQDMEKCKLHTDDKMLCSGRGLCRCGRCEVCHSGFSGNVCQFDDTACPRKNKLLCSNNGICTQGKCECNSLWSGVDCSCPLENTACITPYSKKVCSGQGKCVCGNCICDKQPDKDETYTGIYCDMCDDCGEKHCKEYEDYVLCNILKNKTLCDNLYLTTDTLVYVLNTTHFYGSDWNGAQYCKKRLDNDSQVIFKYKYDGNLVLGIQNKLEFPPNPSVFIAVGAALGAVLFMGIVTLIVWKILIDMHDKNEYEKFAQESVNKGFTVFNSLYKEPGATFVNPAFQAS